MRRIGLAAALALVVFVSGSIVNADETRGTAAELFRAGSTAFARGEYRAAALAYEEADRRLPHPMTLCNAGFAWDRAGEPARAADAFHGAIARGGLAEPQASNAASRLAELERELGAIEVRVAGGGEVTVEHAVRRTVPVRVHLAPGEHEVRIDHPDGRRSNKRVRVSAGEVTPVTFAAPAPMPARVVRVREPTPAPEADSSPMLPSSGGLRSAQRAPRSERANVAFGTAVVTGGVGVTLLIVSATSSDAPSATSIGLTARGAF